MGKLEHLRYEFKRLTDRTVQEAYGRLESALTASVVCMPQEKADPSGQPSLNIRRANFPSDDSLRVAATWLLDAEFRIITYKPRQEKVRSYLCSACTRTAVIYCLTVLILGYFLTALALWDLSVPTPSVMVFVIIAGCLGAMSVPCSDCSKQVPMKTATS